MCLRIKIEDIISQAKLAIGPCLYSVTKLCITVSKLMRDAPVRACPILFSLLYLKDVHAVVYSACPESDGMQLTCVRDREKLGTPGFKSGCLIRGRLYRPSRSILSYGCIMRKPQKQISSSDHLSLKTRLTTQRTDRSMYT